MGSSRMILISHRGNIDGKNLRKENTTDYILNAVNLLIGNKGGMVASLNGMIKSVELELAGLMTHRKPADLIRQYSALLNFTNTFGMYYLHRIRCWIKVYTKYQHIILLSRTLNNLSIVRELNTSDRNIAKNSE